MEDEDLIEYRPDGRLSPIGRSYTKEDADSLIGGESIEDLEGPEEPDEKPKQHKVFLFTLPFGGFSGIRFPKLNYMGMNNSSNGNNIEDRSKNMAEVEALRLRLQRLETLSTLDQARVFQHVKRTDDVRLRAVKHSLRENFAEILPDFIRKENAWEAVYSKLDGPILVMGGFRGLILRDTKTKKRAWVPIKAGLNLKQVNLLLGPSDEDELHAPDTIYPDGILKNVGPFDICRRLIRKLDNNPNTTVKDFGYDWRLSLDLVADQLIAELELQLRKTGKKTIVIAHSMGGLVAHGALHKRPDLFRGIVYVGLPSECLNILGPIRYGDSIMFSDKILTFETNFMMRSAYSFLPLSGRVFVDRNTGENYDLDYFDPETWVEYNLNPLVAKERREMAEAVATTESSTNSVEIPDSSESSSAFGSISSRIRLISPGISRKNKPLINIGKVPKRVRSPLSPLSPTSESELVEKESYCLSFDEAYEYLSRTLKRAKTYMEGLEYRPELDKEYPPLAVVYGDKIPSVRGLHVDSIEDIRNGNYYRFYYGKGDGVVNLKWLMPEAKGFQMYNPETKTGHIVGKFASESGHVDLMTDLKVMGEALESILDAETVWLLRFDGC